MRYDACLDGPRDGIKMQIIVQREEAANATGRSPNLEAAGVELVVWLEEGGWEDIGAVGRGGGVAEGREGDVAGESLESCDICGGDFGVFPKIKAESYGLHEKFANLSVFWEPYCDFYGDTVELVR